jgi:hypothetical protein
LAAGNIFNTANSDAVGGPSSFEPAIDCEASGGTPGEDAPPRQRCAPAGSRRTQASTCNSRTTGRASDGAHPDARNLMLQPPVQSPLRTGALPPGALMAAPVASAPDMPASPRTSFGSD